MNIFWPASFVKFPWHCWTEFSKSWKDLREILWRPENPQSLTDLSGASIAIHSNSRIGYLTILNVHDVKDQYINEQERAVLERCVFNSIFYLHKNSKNAIPKYKHIISLLHVYRVHLLLPELYSVVLISLNVKWNIRMK